MKPRLRMSGSWWICYTDFGVGYVASTPQLAYNGWLLFRGVPDPRGAQ